MIVFEAIPIKAANNKQIPPLFNIPLLRSWFDKLFISLSLIVLSKLKSGIKLVIKKKDQK